MKNIIKIVAFVGLAGLLMYTGSVLFASERDNFENDFQDDKVKIYKLDHEEEAENEKRRNDIRNEIEIKYRNTDEYKQSSHDPSLRLEYDIKMECEIQERWAKEHLQPRIRPEIRKRLEKELEMETV